MFTNIAVGSLMTGALFTFIVGAVEIGSNVVETEPVAMRLAALEYDGALIHQHVKITGRDSIRGEWAATIMRGYRRLCGGGGISNYRGMKMTLTPSEWTGSECPDIEAGDVASASWQWTDADGLVRGISGAITIK